MSRSRRKTLGYNDRNPEMKRLFNRSVRRKLNQHHDFEIADGGAYKKMNESYDICDWKCLYFSKSEWDFQHGRDEPEFWFIPMYQAQMK